MTINKHGLPRTVPEGIKRQIRQRCGFGCVICGLGFYEYEHFDPDYCDAHEHNPDGMTLLCSQCNQKRARNRLSAKTVAEANNNPKCLQQGFAHEMFDFHSEPLRIVFAGNTFYNCLHLIMINGTPILSVEPSPDENKPILLSGLFCDSAGRESLRIIENEWIVDSGYWDVECEGPKIIIRSAPRKICLALRMLPPEGIVIERLEMFYQGVFLKGNENVLEICYDGKNWHRWSGVSMKNFDVAISFIHGPLVANDACY